MIKKLIPLVVLPLMAVLASCAPPTPEKVELTPNGMTIMLLTLIEGCNLYRIDQGNGDRDVYTTICPRDGEATTQWTQSCGKGCSRTVHVQTARKMD